jgi:hypothetical protein
VDILDDLMFDSKSGSADLDDLGSTSALPSTWLAQQNMDDPFRSFSVPELRDPALLRFAASEFFEG